MAKFLQSVEVIVMTDIQRAMLGDHDAAARLTEQGVLILCPHCGGEVELKRIGGGYSTGPVTIREKWTVVCKNKCHDGPAFESCIYQNDKGDVCITKNGAKNAIEAWNTRAPLLTLEQIERLEEMI